MPTDVFSSITIWLLQSWSKSFVGGKWVLLFFCLLALFHLVLSGHHTMYNMFVCLFLPLPWSVAIYLWCMLSLFVGVHFVLNLIFCVLKHTLGCMCMSLWYQCLALSQKFLHACFCNGFVVTVIMWFRSLGDACIVCILCIGIYIVGCLRAIERVLLNILLKLATNGLQSVIAMTSWAKNKF